MTDKVSRGAYVLADTEGTPDVILMASGSEVSVALEARQALAADGIAARVVSVPCLDWFEAQDRAYRDEVLPPSVRARVSVEAGLALPWYRWIGDAGRVGLHRALRRLRAGRAPLQGVRHRRRARRRRREGVHRRRPVVTF